MKLFDLFKKKEKVVPTYEEFLDRCRDEIKGFDNLIRDVPEALLRCYYESRMSSVSVHFFLLERRDNIREAHRQRIRESRQRALEKSHRISSRFVQRIRQV